MLAGTSNTSTLKAEAGRLPQVLQFKGSLVHILSSSQPEIYSSYPKLNTDIGLEGKETHQGLSTMRLHTETL